jgi:DNA-binding NarL/FixJ family response regulator
MTYILIADPDASSRKALGLLITQKIKGTHIQEAGDTEMLIRNLADQRIDILLLDWSMYGAPAPQTCRLLLKAYPGLKIVLLSLDFNDCQTALDSGAGFIHKGAYPDEVLAALQPVIDAHGDEHQTLQPE